MFFLTQCKLSDENVFYKKPRLLLQQFDVKWLLKSLISLKLVMREYWMPKKSWPILFSSLLYEMGQDIFDKKYKVNFIYK